MPKRPTVGTTERSSSAPDKTKNSMKIGGVSPSVSFMICGTCEEKLAKPAPMAMHIRSDEKPNILAAPTPKKTKAMISDKRFPSFLNQRSGTQNSIPRSTPKINAPKLSHSGSKIADFRETCAGFLRAWATATEMLNMANAVASSMATTDKSVSVTGPLALY